MQIRGNRGPGGQAGRPDRGNRSATVPGALEAATAKTEQDQADLANAQQDLVRYTDLAQKSFASRQQVDTQRAMVNRLTAVIAGDNAAVTNAKLNLSYCYITSPIEGRIGLRQIDPGNMVHASDATAIVSITQIHPISVLFTLPQDSPAGDQRRHGEGQAAGAGVCRDDKTELDLGVLLTLTTRSMPAPARSS